MSLRFTVTARQEDLAFLRRLGAGNASRGFRKLLEIARSNDPILPMNATDLVRAALYLLEQEDAA